MSMSRYAALCTGLLAAGLALAEPIKVGIALDISGPYATSGAEARDGFNLAIEQLGGKLGGVEAEFLQADFAGDPEQATRLVTRYIRHDKIDFFTGPIGSNSALAVAPRLFAAEIPFLSSNPGPSQLAGKQCNAFFFGQSQNTTYDEAAGVVANEAGYHRMALVAPNYPTGRDHIGGFKRTYQGEIAHEIYTKVGQIDYSAELANIRTAKPQAVFAFLPGAMGHNFAKQYVAAGLSDIPLVMSGPSADEHVIHTVGDALIGVQSTSHWSHDLENPANRSFVESFRQRYDGRYPSLYAAMAYDVILAMDAAVREVGGKVENRAAVIAAIKNANYPSIRGDFTYGINHFPIQNFYLRTVMQDPSGRLTNKLENVVLNDHQDAYISECTM